MIYLDNAATTKVFDSAITAAERAMADGFFNPNATYKHAVSVKTEIDKCRQTIASASGATGDELIFTSCATEANNWVFEHGRKSPKGNVVISAGEHPSVYEPAMRLASRGIDVRIAPITRDGQVDEDAFSKLVDENTSLVSVIHVSNETGTVNPIKKLSYIVRKKAPRALFHSDGVQALLKTHERLDSLGVDLYSASAHKLGAPKGIGLLYIRRGITIAPFMLGGGQERNMRSGTQNTPYIAAFASAVQQFSAFEKNNNISNIRDELCAYFSDYGCKIVGGDNSVYILCVHFPNVKAEILQNLAADNGVIIGKGAACSGSKRGNRVLAAMGLSEKEIECCVRISLFPNITRDDVMEAAGIIISAADSIRSNNVG